MSTKIQIINRNHINEIYCVTIRPCVDTTGYWAECKMNDGGCVVQGETLQDTQKKMVEAIEFYLEDYPEISNYYLNFELLSA